MERDCSMLVSQPAEPSGHGAKGVRANHYKRISSDYHSAPSQATAPFSTQQDGTDVPHASGCMRRAAFSEPKEHVTRRQGIMAPMQIEKHGGSRKDGNSASNHVDHDDGPRSGTSSEEARGGSVGKTNASASLAVDVAQPRQGSKGKTNASASLAVDVSPVQHEDGSRWRSGMAATLSNDRAEDMRKGHLRNNANSILKDINMVDNASSILKDIDMVDRLNDVSVEDTTTYKGRGKDFDPMNSRKAKKVPGDPNMQGESNMNISREFKKKPSQEAVSSSQCDEEGDAPKSPASVNLTPIVGHNGVRSPKKDKSHHHAGEMRLGKQNSMPATTSRQTPLESSRRQSADNPLNPRRKANDEMHSDQDDAESRKAKKDKSGIGIDKVQEIGEQLLKEVLRSQCKTLVGNPDVAGPLAEQVAALNAAIQQESSALFSNPLLTSLDISRSALAQIVIQLSELREAQSRMMNVRSARTALEAEATRRQTEAERVEKQIKSLVATMNIHVPRWKTGALHPDAVIERRKALQEYERLLHVKLRAQRDGQDIQVVCPFTDHLAAASGYSAVAGHKGQTLESRQEAHSEHDGQGHSREVDDRGVSKVTFKGSAGEFLKKNR